MESGTGAAITAQILGAGNRFRTILALVSRQNLSSKIRGSVNELMRRSFDPNERRNRIVHDAWFVQLASGQPAQFRSMATKDLRFGLVEIEQAEIDKTISDISGLTVRVNALREQILNELPHEKHP